MGLVIISGNHLVGGRGHATAWLHSENGRPNGRAASDQGWWIHAAASLRPLTSSSRLIRAFFAQKSPVLQTKPPVRLVRLVRLVRNVGAIMTLPAMRKTPTQTSLGQGAIR